MREFSTALALGAAALLAGCDGGIEGAKPAVLIKTDACPRAFDKAALTSGRLAQTFARRCAGDALALSPDGTKVAVAGARSVELFDTRNGQSTVVVEGGADALAAGAGLPARLLAQSTAKGTVRLLRFDNGVATYAARNIRTTVADNPHADPFRSNGSGLEASSLNDARAVRAMSPKRKGEMLYSLWIPEAGYNHDLYVSAVDDSLTAVAWARDSADADGRNLYFMRYPRTLLWAEPGFATPPRWRAFSRDGSAFGGELEGRTLVWDVSTGKVSDRYGEADGACALGGRAVPAKGELAVVCARAGALSVWRAPGRRLVGEVPANKGWTTKAWRLSADGGRLAVLETGPLQGEAAAMRVRLVPLAAPAGSAERVVDLGRIARPERLAFAIDAAGATLAIRRPDGRVAIYR
ncbi:hypothetical protein [Caulobacter sp. 17J80-11]|uniref:hypothetical protein n=1 Tax=Caulobacter sp. 17J80-11 TaxID=2763502 RepID=UPI00165370C7|nr:hypothetical protein [Caulobacter sp. 17J80-11]MBC6982172.1 hypothetical protein [Caulobacter sp. 17J80-11]